jgi:hypothetical protein
LRLARSGRRCLLAPLALAVLAIAPAAAHASVTTSSITTPTGPVFSMYDNQPADPTTQQTFAISGTSNGTTGDQVDIRCYYRYDYGRRSYSVASAVPVDASGNFTATGNFNDVSGSSHSCVLRAVPAGSDPAFLPDFAGPSMHVGRVNTKPTAGANYWDVEQTQAQGRLHYNNPSECGLKSRPYFDGTDYNSFYWAFRPWSCAAALYNSDGYSSSEIVIDGHIGFDPYQQQYTDAATTGKTDLQQWSSQSDPANGNLTIVERGEIKRCVDASNNAVDSTSPGSSCVALVPTGVTRERTIVQNNQGQTATVTDKWISNDNAAHKAQLAYDNGSESCGDNSFYCNFYGPNSGSAPKSGSAKAGASTTGAATSSTSASPPPTTTSCWYYYYYFSYCAPNPDPTVYKLPGETTYNLHNSGDTVEGLAAAPATIYVQVSDERNAHAYGSMTYTTAPDGLVWRWNAEFIARYNRTVPAGGTLTLTHIYGQAPTASQIGVLGTTVEDAQQGPTVTITAPANGSTVKTAKPTITGTATDNVGVKTLTVNGHSVTPNANGTWSTSAITLKAGSNTITAIATDGSGNTAQAQSIVIYKPAAARTCKVPNVKGKSLSSARTAIKKAGCVVGKVNTKATKKVKPGRVMTQSRKAGSRVAIATRVNLTIARPTAVRPSFTG